MRKKLLIVALGACLFLLITGAKWATFDRFGSPMPDWDQWDAEGVELFIPWFEHDHFLQHFFHPHNEHRVILTKLQNLALAVISGQWDSRLEAATNALLHAALAVGFWELGRRRTAARWHAGLFLLIAALFGLPLAWQNILGGFHSQQYWLLGLSFTAIVLLPFAQPGRTVWWFGLLAAILSLGSMGSGFLAAAVVIVVLGWRIARGETTLRQCRVTLAIMLALVAVGVLTRVEFAPHLNLKARTAHDFFFSIVHSLQWPLRDRDWAGAILWLPWLLVFLTVLRRRAQPDNAAFVHAPQAIAALGGWVLLQLVATAYARGAGADYPASRYMDTLSFGAAVNGIALAWLLSHVGPRGFARLVLWSAALAWSLTLIAGLRELCERNVLHELPDAKKYYTKAEANLRRFLATGDPKSIVPPEIPYPSVDDLMQRLRRESVRQLMPLPIRAPLEMKAAPGSESNGFEANSGIGADPENPPRRGLSPKTYPLDYTSTWGSYQPTAAGDASTPTWQSEPLSATLGAWLKFETAGNLTPGSHNVTLDLRDAKTGEVLAQVAPKKTPGDTWRAAYVRAPKVPFVITATDRSSTEWLAFSAPVEMSRSSYLAWQATKNGLLLVWLAGGLTIVVGFVQLLHRKSATQPDRCS